MSEKDLSNFVQSLEVQQFTHKDVMKCYSIYMKNEYTNSKKKGSPAKNSNQTKRTQIKWSEEEVNALKSGVEKFGNNWKQIFEENIELFTQNGRSVKNLRKKYASLKSSL